MRPANRLLEIIEDPSSTQIRNLDLTHEGQKILRPRDDGLFGKFLFFTYRGRITGTSNFTYAIDSEQLNILGARDFSREASESPELSRKVSELINMFPALRLDSEFMNKREDQFEHIFGFPPYDETDLAEALLLNEQGSRVSIHSVMEALGEPMDPFMLPEDTAELSWAIQRAQAEIADKLGYDGLEVIDEYGSSYMINVFAAWPYMVEGDLRI